MVKAYQLYYGDNKLELPYQAKILSVANVNYNILLYAEVDNELPSERKFFVAATDERIPMHYVKFVGTVVIPPQKQYDQHLVYHVFEL